MAERIRLGELLVEAGILSYEQLDEVLAKQMLDGRRLGTLLVEEGLVTETQVTQLLSQQLSVPWVSLYHVDFSRQLLDLVPREVAERYCVIPIYVRRLRGQGDTVYVAMDDPTDERARQAIAEFTGLPVRAMIAPPSDVRNAIRAYYRGSVVPPGEEDAELLDDDEPETELEPIGRASPQAPARDDAAVSTKPESPDAQRRAASDADDVEVEVEPESDDDVEVAADEPEAASDAPADTGPDAERAFVPTDAVPVAAVASAGPSDDWGAGLAHQPAAAEDGVVPDAAAGASSDAALLSGTDGAALPHEPEPMEHHQQRELRAPSQPPRRPARTVDGAPPPAARPSADLPRPLDPLRGRAEAPPDSAPQEVAARDRRMPRARKAPARPMITMTLLDGTQVSLPVKGAGAERGDHQGPLTARDLVAALRAVAHGADASKVLGQDVRWETLVASLLSILLKKHLVADWEFVEEYERIVGQGARVGASDGAAPAAKSPAATPEVDEASSASDKE